MIIPSLWWERKKEKKKPNKFLNIACDKSLKMCAKIKNE